VDLERTPLAGVSVTAAASGAVVATADTAADGSYALTLPAGAYTLTAAKPGFTRRAQPVTVTGDTTVHFGPQADALGNPWFLADDPEIEAVAVKEASPGQGLTLELRLSEPLTAAAQQAFTDAFRLYAGTETPFLRPGISTVARRRLEASWDKDGQRFTCRYAGPYLASGELDASYAVALAQDELEDERDPVTRETKWEDLGLVDAGGRSLGRGQTRFAFKRPEFFELSAFQLTDPTHGYFVQDRRWRLTHEGLFRFKAARDADGPAVLEGSLRYDRESGALRADILTLTLNEPMSAAKNASELYYTQLDKARDLVVLNGSAESAGLAFKPVAASLRPREVVIDLLDARVVELHYPVGSFDGLKRLEVTLGPDMRDPAGNRPDATRSKVVVVVPNPPRDQDD
jgi:hypothetical protein